MTKYLDYEGLQKFKECADAKYLPQKGTIPITDKINLTSENVLTLGAKVAKVANNSMNFYIIADSQGKLPSSETRINVPSSITSLVGAEGANVGDIFVVAKLNSLPVYRIIPLNDAKAANSTYAGTNGVMTPWDKSRVNKVDSIEGTANNALNRANNALNNLPTFSESNMNNALATGVYPWCTLGRPANSTGAYTCITIHSTTKDSGGFDTIEQTAYGRQGELGKVYKRIIFKNDSETQFGDWLEISNVTSATKKSKPKTQYIIGKAIPIGSLNGGARLNAYAVNGFLRFKLSRVPQLGSIICRPHTGTEVNNLLRDVTWHVFIDGEEQKDFLNCTECMGDILRVNIELHGFYMLDTANSSVDLSSDMYIYLKNVFEGPLDGVKCTSETLHYRAGKRIWEPFINLPSIKSGYFDIRGFDPKYILLQKLHTRQCLSKLSGKDRFQFSHTSYRGRFGGQLIKHYGVYRYRVVKNGKKTQWCTINIMKANKERSRFIIK